ncbi:MULTISPECIES: antitoxin [Arthrobacter]|uniref:Antitoxin n=1 Tax=Arthrobacter sunyaminii TaxID=2816859 RepID=A0A975S856_9MICC|nr:MULTISPECIES: antitoxin [Arthrobacter]MBO0906841.1 antitoxin [Arthrobacter sunyaminii]QWQ37602.1 antitoxin [Arthrobacter sunyaminii]
MSIFDGLKGKAGELKGKATELVGENADKIKGGIGHAGKFVDEKTGGKYSDKIDGFQSKASEAVDKVDRNQGPATGTEPGPTPPAV